MGKNIVSIPSLLAKGDTPYQNDKCLFQSWEGKTITTQRALSIFKSNNYITEDIDESVFVKWLNSLGYLRD